MNTIIGLKELRENMDRYAVRVKKGESFIVVRKSKPLFALRPLESEETWESIVDFTKIRKGGVSIQDVLKRL